MSGKVIPFGVPAAVKPQTNASSCDPKLITQTELEEWAEAKACFREAKQTLQEAQDVVVWKLVYGGRVEPGPITVRLVKCVRQPNGKTRGATYYRVLMG